MVNCFSFLLASLGSHSFHGCFMYAMLGDTEERQKKQKLPRPFLPARIVLVLVAWVFQRTVFLFPSQFGTSSSYQRREMQNSFSLSKCKTYRVMYIFESFSYNNTSRYATPNILPPDMQNLNAKLSQNNCKTYRPCITG